MRGAGSLRNLPLIVVTAGKPATAYDSEVRVQRTRIELLGGLARKSTRGRRVVVANSGQIIPYAAPQAVINAIRKVVREAQDRRFGH
jgi:hypothetical protein